MMASDYSIWYLEFGSRKKRITVLKGANKSANVVNILVPEKQVNEQTTLLLPFTSAPPLPMRESEVHPQMMISVYS